MEDAREPQDQVVVEETVPRRLTEAQKKAFQELKKLIQDAFDKYELTTSYEGGFTIWGIPLIGNEKGDHVILKFLRARNYNASHAFAMLKNALSWRREAGIESIMEENFEDKYRKLLFTHGYDREGHPIWYLILEECLNNGLSQCTSFLRWLIYFVEKNIRDRLDFESTNANSFLLVIDLKNSPQYYGNRDLYKNIHKFLQLLDDYYPDILAKQLWINASWWYRGYCRVYSLVYDEWGINKVVFAGSSKTIDTLFKYISPGELLVKYGGLSREVNRRVDTRFTAVDPVSEITIKPASKHTLEFAFAEECDIYWEFRVLGWDVNYEAEFVPSTEGRYITIISNRRKVIQSEEPVISENYRVSEPGKLVLIINNANAKKIKLLIRFRVVAGNTDSENEASLRGWLLQTDE